MKEKIIVSDFDGTITKKDTLSTFLELYADKEWLVIEDKWVKGEIGSAECLQKQFNLVNNLSPELIDSFVETMEIDDYFEEFNKVRLKNNVDFLILSDGLDYFINRILQKHDIENVKIVSNHAKFKNDKFLISFPNQNSDCIKHSGTCKCNVIKNLRQNYKEIYYIGDGTSDICVADKSDFLFAKSTLLNYCKKIGLNCIEFGTYKEVVNYDRLGFNI